MKDIEINYLIEAENPSLDILIEAQKKLDNAWELWRIAEGTKVAQKITSDERAPRLLKMLFENNSISRISWEMHEVSSDFMPDSAQKLFCWNNEKLMFTIVFNMGLSTADAIAFGLIESGEITRESFAYDVMNDFLLGDDFEDEITQEESDEIMSYLYTLFILSRTVDARLQD